MPTGPGNFCGGILTVRVFWQTLHPASSCALRRHLVLLRRKQNLTKLWLGGFDFADRPSAPARSFSVFWHGDYLANILPVEALPAQVVGDGDAFDLLSVPHPVTILRSLDGEHVLISDGPRSLRFDVVAGSLLSGPVHLVYRLSGFTDIEAKIMTLRRLLALERLGRLPVSLFPPERKACRWAMMLQAHDGMQAGASQREIAIALFGEDRVSNDWQADYLRSRIQRLIRSAEKMILGGGYRTLLQ